LATQPSLTPKPLIYSIDDDPSMNSLMDLRFTRFGCEIKTFVEPDSLFKAIEAKRPKLLLVDLNLGEGLSGFDVIELVRDKMNLDFPIIVVSSMKETSKMAHALELGATDYVVKPPFRFQFEEKISEYIQSSTLPDFTPPSLRPVPVDQQATKISFPLTLFEVNPIGFTFLSPHLIKKGSSFWISGDFVSKIIPTKTSLFVTVLGSATHSSEDQKHYLIRVEVDPTQDDVIQGIRNFLTLSTAPAQADSRR
jgi:CheY-like chemotaxis protein